jgi:HlyD family secretion protein
MKLWNRRTDSSAPRVRGGVPWARIIFVGSLCLAALSSANALRGGTSGTVIAKDINSATRQVPPPPGTHDDRTDLGPAGAAGGDGIVEPADRETKVAAAVPGRIAAILVREGDHVEVGAALVELESGPEQAALAAAEADVLVARADFAKATHGQRSEDVEAAIGDSEAAKARSALSDSVYERTQNLVRGGALPPDELDKAGRQAEIDRHTSDAAQARRNAVVAGSRSEDILSARARIASAAAKRDQAKSNLERLTVRAPIAGEILQSKYRAGEYETPGAGQDPLIVMGDTRELRVRLDVDERDIGKVSPSAAAFVTADAYPGRKFGGHVTEIGKRMGRKNVRTDDPTERIDTKILEVVITLDQRDGLIPGLRVSGYVIAPGVR